MPEPETAWDTGRYLELIRLGLIIVLSILSATTAVSFDVVAGVGVMVSGLLVLILIELRFVTEILKGFIRGMEE